MEEKEEMRDLAQFTAQVTADIEAIDSAVIELQEKAEALREEQVELRKVLKKLTAADVVEESVPP